MSPKVSLEHIGYAYDGRPAVDDVTVSFSTGRVYGVIGPNGCGKTTLLDLIIGYRTPQSGSIAFQGKPLRKYNRKQIAREIALVPQNFYINFPFTVEDVVMMGRYPHIPRFQAPSSDDRRKVEAVMRQIDVWRLKHRYITDLSGGERQRVIFARALTQGASVLLLDEATSNMDVNHSIATLKIAADQAAQHGATIIAVMQDMNLAAMYCDDLVFMKEGRIVVEGPISDTFQADTIRRVFAVEAKIYFDSYCQSHQIVFKR